MLALALQRRSAANSSAARCCPTRPTLSATPDGTNLSLAIRIVGERFPSLASKGRRGDAGMKAVLFYHAFTSCWNNGNVHFLRGVSRELQKLGHEVVVYEPANGWSRLNAIQDGGEPIFSEVMRLFPHIDARQYDLSLDLQEPLDG